MYNPLFAITVEEEDAAKAIVRYLFEHAGDGFKQAMRGNKGISVIHSWGNTFESGTDAAWGLRKYLPHILFSYITPEEAAKMMQTKQWRCMELCQPHFFPAIILYDKESKTVFTCHKDTAGTYHPARYVVK